MGTILTALTLIVHTNFRKINFHSHHIDYENIFTTKISRFTVCYYSYTTVVHTVPSNTLLIKHYHTNRMQHNYHAQKLCWLSKNDCQDTMKCML